MQADQAVEDRDVAPLAVRIITPLLAPLTCLGAGLYLVWRLGGVVASPSALAVAMWIVEALAWLGFATFAMRFPGRAPAPEPSGATPTPILLILAGDATPESIERSLASIHGPQHDVRTVVVDTLWRTEIAALASRFAAEHSIAAGPGPMQAVHAVLPTMHADEAVVLLAAGSLLSARALGDLVAPMADERVSAVQGGITWGDASTMAHVGPGRDALALFSLSEAPAASAAGVAPLIGDATALRVRELFITDSSATIEQFAVQLAAKGWLARYVDTPLVRRPRPASAGEWRRQRTAESAAHCRAAWHALTAGELPWHARCAFLCGVSNIVSAWARVGFVAVLASVLVTGRDAVPGHLAMTIGFAGALWFAAAVCTRLAVGQVLRSGDRLRLGWRCVDADVLGGFRALRRSVPRSTAPKGHHRTPLPARLGAFPVTLALVALLDAAAILRGSSLLWPSIVPSLPSTLSRAMVAVFTASAIVLMIDALRIFVSRPDVRREVRVPAGAPALLAGQSARLVDVSVGGAGVQSSTPPPVASIVDLDFALATPEGLAVLNLHAEVAYVRPGADGSHVGLRFVDTPAEARTALMRYSATAPTPFIVGGRLGLPDTMPSLAWRALYRFGSIFAIVASTSALAVTPAFAATAALGTVHGTVTSSGRPVSGICVTALPANAGSFQTTSDQSGHWSMNIPAGSYRIRYQDCRSLGNAGASAALAGGWWDGIHPNPQSHSVPISIAEHQTLREIDVALVPGSTISGTLRVDPSGDACVTPVTLDGEQMQPALVSTSQATLGTFSTESLSPGYYRLRVSVCTASSAAIRSTARGVADGWFASDGSGVTADLADARVIAVGSPAQGSAAQGSTAQGTSALVLDPVTAPTGARVTGSVHDDTGLPAAGVCVAILGAQGNWVSGTASLADGSYRTDPIPAGDWVIGFDDCRTQPTLAAVFWDSTVAGTHNFSAARRVHISANDTVVATIDQPLRHGGSISGAVTANDGPAAAVCVDAYTDDGSLNWVGGTQTARDGTFSLPDLPATDVALGVTSCRADSDAVTQGFFAGYHRPVVGDPAQAALIRITADQPTTDTTISVTRAARMAGVVTSDGVPQAGACVAVLDPSTGVAYSPAVSPAGEWTTAVVPGSYLVQAYSCHGSPGMIGVFAPGSALAITAQHFEATTQTPITNVTADIALTTSATAAFGQKVFGIVHSPKGTNVSGACVMALVPGASTGPIATAVTHTDGTFTFEALAPGAYGFAITGCNSSTNQNANGTYSPSSVTPSALTPSPVTSPDNPALEFAPQWISGMRVNFNNVWANPQWTQLLGWSNSYNLGTLCLGCQVDAGSISTPSGATVPVSTNWHSTPAFTRPQLPIVTSYASESSDFARVTVSAKTSSGQTDTRRIAFLVAISVALAAAIALQQRPRRTIA